MRLYIGGYRQGKSNYARKQNPGMEDRILDGLHLWVRQLMENGEDAEVRVREYLDENPDAIIICDEVGSGIVPVDAFEREYRERLGRILTEVAERASVVERVFCGIGQRIKG